MDKIKKFLKDNWQTGLGIGSFFFVVIESCTKLICDSLASNGIDERVCVAILSPFLIMIFNAMAKAGLEFGKQKENRLLCKDLGCDKANEKLKDNK